MLISSSAVDYSWYYIDFLRTLTWFERYCDTFPDNNAQAYAVGIQNIRYAHSYLQISIRTAKQIQTSEPYRYQWHTSGMDHGSELITKLEEVLEQEPDNIGYVISTHIREFLHNTEQSFSQAYREAVELAAGIEVYDLDLYWEANSLIERSHNDEAVTAAFKYLDRTLQGILRSPGHELYGEALVNAAFSEDKGALQLGTNSSEQRGLRNLFSGAYAVFRNIAVHRSLFKNESDLLFFQGGDPVGEVVGFVSVLARITRKAYELTLSGSIRETLKQISPEIAQGVGWREEVHKFQGVWTLRSVRPASPASGDAAMRELLTIFLENEEGEWGLTLYWQPQYVAASIPNKVAHALATRTSLSVTIKVDSGYHQPLDSSRS